MQHGTISYDQLVVSVFDLRHEKKLYCDHEKKTQLRPRKKNYCDKKMLKKVSDQENTKITY